MTSIRIAIAAALVLVAGFAGATAHASRGQTPARYDALAPGAVHAGPILCCDR